MLIMTRTNYFFRLLFLLVLLKVCKPVSGQDNNDNPVMRERLRSICNSLDTLFFVNRFESVESPCLFMDSADDHYAIVNRKSINSNYRTKLLNDVIDTSGVKCLSNNYAKYLRFRADSTNEEQLTITGSIEITYGYPASGVMQYLCRNRAEGVGDTGFFNRLLRNHGWFKLYPDKDKYVLALVVQDRPYDPMDTAYAFLEITEDYFRSDPHPSYHFIFDRISLAKGDKNNQLSLRFTSTNTRNEMIYYTVMVHNIVKDLSSPDRKKQAYALWLRNYLTNSACIHCDLIYEPALRMNEAFRLPNTRPQPAH